MNRALRRALISVTDKTELTTLARALTACDVELIASGGTAKELGGAGFAVTPVESLTKFPEMLGGRVKTLHPAIHAGLLADRDQPRHLQDLEAHDLKCIDMVVVNFYRFEEAMARNTATNVVPIEAIDIGGPTLVRAAAKNHKNVVVLTAVEDYPEFLEALASDRIDAEFRQRMAARAFERVAQYDRAIADGFASVGSHRAADESSSGSSEAEVWAPSNWHKYRTLRYGENPHQKAVAYRQQPAWGLGQLEQVAGPELSYNNLVDADAALDLAFDFGARPACAIIKHNNPCGVATGATAAEAYTRALQCDPLSAYGGVIAFNVSVDAQTAEALGQQFIEVLAAPEVQAVARQKLAKKKKLRILEVPREGWQPESQRQVAKSLHGLTLLQDRDLGFDEIEKFDVVTRRQPNADEWDDLRFLLVVGKHVRSNAIVIGRDRRTLGIGAGQMSRVDSCDLAIKKARDAKLDLADSVAVSDAFFPFADGIQRLAEAGVVLVLQPGGSKRDAEVVAAANDLGIGMVFTGKRHFTH